MSREDLLAIWLSSAITVLALAAVAAVFVLWSIRRHVSYRLFELDDRLDWATRTVCKALEQQQTTDLDASFEVRG